jgi:hypothetical protein
MNLSIERRISDRILILAVFFFIFFFSSNNTYSKPVQKENKSLVGFTHSNNGILQELSFYKICKAVSLNLDLLLFDHSHNGKKAFHLKHYVNCQELFGKCKAQRAVAFYYLLFDHDDTFLTHFLR